MPGFSFLEVPAERHGELCELQRAYKAEIGEAAPSEADLRRMEDAIKRRAIVFFGCVSQGRLVAVCSVSNTFSTYSYEAAGVFEDFYILPEYRHQGIARRLAAYAFEQSGVSSMTVGCAACDRDMYQAIGFSVPLGHLLAYSREGE